MQCICLQIQSALYAEELFLSHGTLILVLLSLASLEMHLIGWDGALWLRGERLAHTKARLGADGGGDH